MSLGAYLAGLASAGGAATLAGVAAVALRSLLLPLWRGAPARLAEAVLGLSLLLLCSQLLGTVGAFRRGWLLLALGLAAAAALLIRRRAAPTAAEPAPERPPLDPWALAPALATAGLVVFGWASRSVEVLGRGMADPDTLWYHMPFAARFAQDGWTTRLHFVESEPMTVFHPANSELLHGIGVVLMGSTDLLSPFVNLGFAGLALLGGWCIGRPYGAAPASLLGVALVLLLPIMLETQPGEAANDAVALAFLLASLGLLVHAGGRAVPLGLAAAALGLAAGTKLSLLAAAAALTVGVIALAPAGARRRHAAVWIGPLLLTGVFWYARNLVHTGNPLPWIAFELGPLSLPSPSTPLSDSGSFSVAHYLTDTGIWAAYFRPALNDTLGPLWPLILALAGGGAALAAVVPRTALTRMLAIVGLATLAAYLVTPATAGGLEGTPNLFGLNLRFLSPGLAIGLSVLPLAAVFAARERQRLVALALALVILATQVADGLPPPAAAGYGAAIALALLASLALPAAVRARRLPWPAAAGAAAALAVVAAVAGRNAEQTYSRERYATERFVTIGAPSVWARSVHGARIGYVGYLLHYPLYGVDLSNRVRFVGRHGPHGAFARFGTCGGWAAALRRGGYRYVVTAPEQSVALEPSERRREPREARWTRALAGVSVLRDPEDRVSVFRIDRRVEPRRCLR